VDGGLGLLAGTLSATSSASSTASPVDNGRWNE
jgi:hypothetical protein